MKKTFTSKVIALCITIISISTANAQISSLFKFIGNPILVSGVANKVNAVYRYSNVAIGTDALVKIVSATGNASVVDLDNNDVTQPENFSPNIKVMSRSTGLVEFKIDFVLTGTSLPRPLDSLYATAMDIDGNSIVHEQDMIDLGGGTASYMAQNPEILITQSGTAFIGTNVGGKEYDGIDTMARQVMFTVKKNNASSITYKVGAINDGNGTVTRQKSLSFKNYTYPAYSTLPVKYISFDGMISNQNVLLKWITAEEVNNSHFEVEHSFDMNSYTTIGVVMDGFEVGSNKSYQFKESIEALKGNTVVYYRLKQFDTDGHFTYSKVISVRLQSKTNTASMQLSPNPFVENVTVQYVASENGNANIQVLNTAGLIVTNVQAPITKGANNLTLEGLSKLSSGLYIARLVIDGKVIASEKIIKN